MPSPNAANKSSAKKIPATKDLGQRLAKRKSQELSSKIVDWNQTGAGVLQQQDEIVVIEGSDLSQNKKEEADEIVLIADNDSNHEDAQEGGDKHTGLAKPKTPVSAAKNAQKTAAQRKASREVDLQKKAWVRRKSKPAAEIEEDLLHVGTPRKRVISDGHWRKDKSSPKLETATPEKERDTTPKPITVRRSVVNVGLKVPPSVQDWVEDPEPAPAKVRPIRQPRSRSRSKSRDRGVTPDYEDSGVKVYVKRRRRSKPLDEDLKVRKDARSSDSSFTAPSSVDKPGSSTDITTPSVSPTKEKPSERLTSPWAKSLRPHAESTPPKSPRRSFEAAETPTHPSRVSRQKTPTTHDHERDQPSSAPRQTIVKPANRPAAPVAPIVHGNRIEGWLANMADPFTEANERALTPEPLAVPGKKSQKRLDDETEVHEHGDSGRRRSSGRARRSRPSLDPLDTENRPRIPGNRHARRSPGDDETDVSLSATPTLKRSGAKRNLQSPVKDHAASPGKPNTDYIEVTEETSSVGESTQPPKEHLRRTSHGRALGARPFPSSGKRLSTIASIDTFNVRTRQRAPSDVSKQPTTVEGSVLSRASDGDEPVRRGASLKRRTTKHSDLISVLSLPRAEQAGIKSARSIRTHRPNLDSATVGDLMNEVTTDELKYQRELRTLVDGVVPVLLQCVLSQSNSAVMAGFLNRKAKDDTSVTKPIVDMGVALERLKASHKRIPMHDPDALLQWAQGANKLYADYLQAWRLGFEDIVVNLAPASDEEKRKASGAWDDGLPRNKGGDLLGGDGERVDVAYLLKRPLVRLKYLAKTFKSIEQIKPSAVAADMAIKYQELVAEARKRSNDEKARLEDEAAANIDPTRARDPRSLAPLTGVSIDHTRCVRARDYFDLDLHHTSGQQVTCKIEIVLRDDHPERGDSGDVLFCEVSTTGRWLLFPPILASNVSARLSRKDGELIVMVRGVAVGGKEWREIMSLQASDGDAAVEWLEMLGTSPVPPSLARKSSFDMLKHPVMSGALPMEVEVPIGERAGSASQRWDGSEVNSICDEPTSTSLRRAKAKRYRSTPSSPLVRESAADLYEDNTARNDRSRYGRPSRDHERPQSSYVPSTVASDWTTSSAPTTPKKEYKVWLPSDGRKVSDASSADEDDHIVSSKRPGMHRRTSSVPSLDMPTVHKLRKPSQPSTPLRRGPSHRRSESTPTGHVSEPEPASAPAKLQKRRTTPPKPQQKSPPPSTRPTSVGLRSSILPSFTPAFLKRHRRSSSPLKHEYEPSTATESSSESDLSDLDDHDSFTSESSADEQISTVGELKPFPHFGIPKQRPQVSPPESQYAPSGPSLAPSQSASQAPYRTVPPAENKVAETVACLFSWSDVGSWDSLHPEECTIVVTPGLIEAFDKHQAHASGVGSGPSPSTRGVKPLVALELTPLVPLRRGTALDISVRSPPTPNSLYRTSNNIMFRSRSSEECQALYNLINRARIDNPTYIALQNARGPVKQSNWAEAMDRRNNMRTNNSSWYNLGSRKSSTYRSKGTRPLSIGGGTESSVGTMNTAFSALRRFSGGSRIFNLAKSSITTREGPATRSTYSDSLSSGAATPLPIDPSMGTPLGLTNVKIRLYIRETASKWRDMGSARLTIMLPPRPDPSIPADPRTTGLEKRVLICGKTQGETLLDATLGETAFERIARTGIAVSVWEQTTGPNGEIGGIGAVGGVLSTRAKVYMVQMKSVSQDHAAILIVVVTNDRAGTRSCIYFRLGGQASILILYTRKIWMVNDRLAIGAWRLGFWSDGTAVLLIRQRIYPEDIVYHV